MRLQGPLEVTSWQEDEVRAEGEEKTTRATIGYRVAGDVEGEAVADVFMCYRADGTAAVVGLFTLTAPIDGRAGTLVFESTGGYDGTTAEGTLRAVHGTGELAGVTGSGTTTATKERVDYTLDLDG